MPTAKCHEGDAICRRLAIDGDDAACASNRRDRRPFAGNAALDMRATRRLDVMMTLLTGRLIELSAKVASSVE